MSIADKLTQIAENEKKVYDAGKKAEYNEFWDDYIEANLLGRYAYTGMSWNKNTFKPSRDLPVSGCAFYYHNWMGTPYDLAEHLENLGIKLKFNWLCTTDTFRMAWLTRIPVCDFSKETATPTNMSNIFNGCTQLVTIDKIILPSEGNINGFNNTFLNCTALKNVTFEGVIPKGISFSNSPLTVESMKSIISCLKDYSGTDSEFTYTLTLKDSCKTSLEADTETIELDGVNYTYFELITAKGWNLA